MIEERVIKISEDGSATLYVPSLDEHYHSWHGAIRESMHIFINAGLEQCNKTDIINILEVGFGTGLNALLTLIHKPTSTIQYHSLEKYPVASNLVSQLNYPELLGSGQLRDLFDTMHSVEWDKAHKLTDDFYLTKHWCDFQDFRSNLKFNLIYFDAFGPDKQPELWTEAMFANIASMTAPGGILTTYSAKGSVRRALQAAGFWVERLPGPPGKRQMIRATYQGV